MSDARPPATGFATDPSLDQPPGPPRRPSGGSNRAALLRLIGVLAVIVVLAAVFNGWAVVVVVGALVVMVMLHELGHFATAKWSGMKVTEYFLGFGPRLWSIRRGETDYGVKAIPAGGYVRIVGMTSAEEVDPADEPRSYRQASFPRRLLVAVAGSAMHFVMAFGLLIGLYAVSGYPTLVSTRTVVGVPALSGVQSPARAAGLRDGDTIVAVDGHHVSDGTQLVDAIEGDAGKATTLTVRRHGHLVTLTATPIDGRHVSIDGQPVRRGKKPVGFLGVDLGVATVHATENPLSATASAANELGAVTRETGVGIADVFSLHGLSNFVHQVENAGNHSAAAGSSGSSTSSGATGSSGQVLSIVGAAEIGVQAAHQDPSELLLLLVSINIFIGMVNLFPMLPLDGGHVLIAVYERVRSRRNRPYHADVTKLMPVAYLFLALIVVFGLAALYANLVAPPSLGS